MQTILVSLISDQTVPNILAIHHFRPDRLLFISTEEMEEKGIIAAILRTMEKVGYRYEYDRIIVRGDSIHDCRKKIQAWIGSCGEARFIINLTGGTKIMSLAAYECFLGQCQKMIYIPGDKIEFYDLSPEEGEGLPTPLDLRLSVSQYLAAYGLEVTNESKLKDYQEEAQRRKDLSEWMVNNYDRLKSLLNFLWENLRDQRDKKSTSLGDHFTVTLEEEQKLLSQIGLTHGNGIISGTLEKSEIRYLTGGWLEEFCFNAVFSLVGLGVNDAVIGLRLKNRQGGENEFDVMFTRENTLYFIECKSLDQAEDAKQALYKVGALQRDFGLQVKSFFVTTSPFIEKDGHIKESVLSRAEQFGTIIIPPSHISRTGKIIAQALHIDCSGIAHSWLRPGCI